MKNKIPELSVFFPAYNEAGNIEEVIKQSLRILPEIAKKFEIIIVNDGSTDATKQISERLSKKHFRVRVVNQKNLGYGGALKRGFKESKYEWIFFTDSDLQFDLKELKKFVRFTKKYQMILGYRKNRAEGLKRALLAKALKIWNRLLLGFPREIKDIDCAFKLLHKDVITRTKPLLSEGAMVSTELLLKAYQADISFKQIGVTHYMRHIGQPTGSNFGVIIHAIQDTFALRLALAIPDFAFSLKSSYTK